MTLIIELIPISTLLAIITNQVLITANAAQDVLIEKESFRTLGNYIRDVQPLLDNLRQRELKDSPAVRTALSSLQDDLKKADTLINNCINKPKMYQLVHCRSIVSEAQQIIRDLGKSLGLMALAGAEVSVDISGHVNRLTEQMMNAELHASESKLNVINKLEQGLRDHRTDRGFANDLIRDIARAVGIPVDDTSEMSKELASFKREKDEAALRKEREEEIFMEQIITLLSQADAAQELPESAWTFRPGRVERKDITSTELIPPFKSFICPLKQDVMDDPVSLMTGNLFERSHITRWFEEGHTSDPVTREELTDRTLRPNNSIRQSIEEWQERNYCIGVLKAKEMLRSGIESDQRAALEEIPKLFHQLKVNQDWIVKERLVDEMVNALKSPSASVKRESLSALRVLVQGNVANKEILANAGGLEQVVRCLSRNTKVAKAAAALLLETLDGNDRLSEKIGQEHSAILLLVTLRNSNDEEAVRLAQLTLDKLSHLAENVVRMAAANWCTPLIFRLCEGRDDSSKVVIVQALGTLNLTDENKVSLAEQGAVAPLVNMLDSGKLEVKLAALSALQNLSDHKRIKECIAFTGAMPIILNLLFSGMSPVRVTQAAAAITENVAKNDGTHFFVNAKGFPEDISLLVENLLGVQEVRSSYPDIRTHVLRTLLGFVARADAAPVRHITRRLQGIAKLLPLIGGTTQNVRDCAIQILFHLADEGAPEIAEYLQRQQKLRTVLRLLSDRNGEDVQAAAAGLLASLPNDPALTSSLIEADAVSALISVLTARNTNYKVKEAAVGALIRFTDSSDVAMQRVVANQDVHPLLVQLIYSESIICKAKAAKALKNFSKSTPSLSVEPDPSCGCFRPSRVPKCPVHSGKCTVKTTFCIVEADAVTGLVSLVSDDNGIAAKAGLEALETLVCEDDILQSGAQYLHDHDGIVPILDTLKGGTSELTESAVKILERIFMAQGMKEIYNQRCRIPLVELASSGGPSVKRQAAKVLAQLGFIDEVSTYY